MNYDISIIGAGVSGALIARELSKYNLNICLIEKESDVAMGTTKANSAIIHAGYDAKPGSLKAKLNVLGNQMFDNISKELMVPFKRIGSFVLAFNDEDLKTLKKLYTQGIINGVPDLRLLNYEESKKLEPNFSNDIKGALYAPSAGIVCPYELTIAATENAIENGVDLILDYSIDLINKQNGTFTLTSNSNNLVIHSKYIINASGTHSDKISALAGDDSFEILTRRGEYILLDKSEGNTVGSTIFQPPSTLGKGILVTPTVDGNLLIGPNAEIIDNKNDKSTTKNGLQEIIDGVKKSIPNISFKNIITNFAGLRAVPSTGDFIINSSKLVPGLINVAGIESPGLSAAPAISEYVVELVQNLNQSLTKKSSFNPIRKPPIKFQELDEASQVELLKKNPLYGNIICRCEQISEGEIVASIQRPCGAKNLDAVKRRTRTGMGRCQSGFCSPKLVEILARELKIPLEEVTKHGKTSTILVSKTK